MRKKHNKISVSGDVALIELAGGLTTIIDAADVGRCSAIYWRISQGRVRHQPTTIAEREKTDSIALPRFLLDAEEGIEVDHRNGDQLDNRRANLRRCSHGENMRNRTVNRSTAAGFKGVKIDKRTGRFVARISAQQQEFHLGVFDDAHAAARAYDAAALEHHGAFARLNFPESTRVD